MAKRKAKAPAKPRNVGGHPRAYPDDEKAAALLAGLGQIQATWVECAAVLGVNEETLRRMFHRSPSIKEAYERGKEIGKTSLRRNLFGLSQRNGATAIFLAMNYLDLVDKRNVGGTVKHDHTHTVLGALLVEIDSEQRDQRVIDATP